MTQSFQALPTELFERPGANEGPLRWALLARLRYQLLGAVLLGVLLPAMVRTGFQVDLPVVGPSMVNTVIGTMIATVSGAFLLRRLSAFPGLTSLSYVLPTFAFTFAATMVVFFFVRLGYSRFQFATSFATVASWFFLVTMVEVRVRRPRLLLLPFGAGHELLDVDGVDWVVARRERQLPLPFTRDASPSRVVDEVGDHQLDDSRRNVTAVVADLRSDLSAHWQSFLADCALDGLPVYHSKQVKESVTGRVEIEHLSENTLGSLLPSSPYYRVKRAIDLVGALLWAPFALALCALAAIAIKLEDGGPVLFVQPRTGHRGRVFQMLKLRTMRNDGEAGNLFTSDGDPRVTRVGRVLRRYRVDELPQIVNILRGDMSWIGPRPEAMLLSQWYQSKIPFYSYRHILRPGLTGWAQVNQGNVGEVDAATDKLHYDFFYIKNFSPWLDFAILVRTARIVFTGFGSR